MDRKKFIILSLGGSLIVPQDIDEGFLKSFKQFIDRHIINGWRFIIVTGGGHTSRSYQQSARKLADISSQDLDWLGIHGTRLNAHLIRTIFNTRAYQVLSNNPKKKISTNKPIIVTSGWKPGWSTDYVSVQMCQTYGINSMINLTNTDYVYSLDPHKYRSAKKISEITWTDYQKLVGKKWNPGAHYPFDPIASGLAKKLNVDVYIVNGKKIKNLSNLLAGSSYKGTHIKN